MRAPRRTFATPFVLTLALPFGACVADGGVHSSSNQPPPPPPPQNEPVSTAPPPRPPVAVVNPPRPMPEEPPPTHTVNPPAPQPEPPKRPPVMNPPRPVPVDTSVEKFDQHWTVSRHGAACTAFNDDACKMPNHKPGDPMPTCNPPMPSAYKCPSDLADGASLKIVRRASATQCVVDAPAFKCPYNAKCNPPPPRVVDCP